MKIHHIGYLVKKPDRALKAFKDLGYVTVRETVFDEFRGVDITFVAKEGYLVELISPKTPDSVVSGLSKKMGNSPYHICYETDDFDADIERLRLSGYVIWQEPAPACAIDGKRVCFLVHPYMGIIELLDTGDKT
ncbi:MAG: VOC family protein [Lachnospiraceae bacterium]|nr:VOC family protein [Lachnospiraceae bacterium]